MNTKKLQHISLALTLSLLALAGVLALLGAGDNGLPVVQAEALPALPAAHLASNDGGWTHSGTQDEWEWGQPSYDGGHGEPLQCAPDSIKGCWVTDLDNTYNGSSSQDLTSVVITLPVTSTAPISVTWYQAWYIDGNNYDHAWAEYRCNGGAWVRLWTHSSSRVYKTWQAVPGGPYTTTCDAGDTLELRYHLDSSSYDNYAGYYIDSIRVFDADDHNLYMEGFEQFQFKKQADRAVVGPGETLTYTLYVANASGNSVATNTILTDTLDVFQRPQTVATDRGSCTIVDSGWGGVVTCTLGNLGIGATAHITLTVQATTTLPLQGFQAITNTAEITGGGDSATAQTSLWLGTGRVRLVEGAVITPYDTIQEAIDAASGVDSEVQVSGSFQGINHHGGLSQMVYISKTLTLRGGYNSDFSVWDPDVYPTTLDAQGNGRVLYIKGDINPTVEYFYITGGNAEGLLPPRDKGGGVYIYGGSPLLRNNYIYENTAGTAGENYGGGLYLDHSNAILDGNEILTNTASGEGIGLYVYSGGVTLQDNTIAHHSYRPGSGAYGAGVYVCYGTHTFEGNIIADNHNSVKGGGLYLRSCHTTFNENTVRENSATSGYGGLGVEDGSITLTANDILSNSNGIGLYETSATLRNNIIRFNRDGKDGGGIQIVSSDVTLENNVIADNKSSSHGSGIYFVTWSDSNRLDLLNNTLARNSEGNGQAFYITSGGGNSVAVFTNTIFYSNTVGVTVGSNSVVTMSMTLWQSNTTDYVGNVDTFVDITGTVAFDADGYHLTAASDAIDAGMDAGVTDDIDGQPRPMGSTPDLGADEYAYDADLSINKTRQGSGAVNAGDMLTYTLTITNAAASEIMADARVVDTVEPASAVAVLTATVPGGDCAAVGAVITCTLHNIVTDTARLVTVWVTTTATYDGIITNTATVTPTNAIDTNGADNAAGPVATTVVYIPPVPDLWVNKTAPAYAEPGETIVYSVTWGNSGGAMAASATLTDTLPAGVTFVAANPPQDSGPNPLVWDLGNAAPGVSGTLIVTVTVNGGLSDGTVLTNTAVITSATTEVVTTNNTADAATTIYQLGGYDLALNKEIIGGAGPYEYGDEVYYQITISNTGQLAADIDMLDEIPAGTAYIPGSVQASGDGTTQDLTGNNDQIRWRGNLGAGGVEVVSFGVTVISPQGVDCGTIRNEAHATIPGVSYQWESQVDFHVLSPDLGVSIEAPQYAARESESEMDAYTIIVTYQNDNNHLYPGDAYTTILTVTLPNNNALLWDSTLPPTRQNSGQEWVWDLGTVADGVEIPIEITIQPSPATAGNDYLVRAEIGSPTPECCQPNKPEEADAHTYMVDMHFQKSAAAPKQSWRVNQSTNQPYVHYEQEYYLQFQHQNADPNAPSASYTVMDMLPDLFTLNETATSPAMEFDDWGLYVDFNSLQPFHTSDSAWIRLKMSAEDLQAGYIYTNSASLAYKINGQELEARAEAVGVAPIAPPLITFPGDGELCGDEFGQVEVRGVAQPDSVVKLFEDIGDGFEETYTTTADFDGSFTLWSENAIPEGLAATLKIYTQACNPVDTNDCSPPSNQVEVWETQGNWCPQLSYWEGTVKSGALKGQYMHFGFRDGDGLYSTTDWVAPGVFGFWDTDLYLYACCGSLTAEIVVTADGIEYQPVDVNGQWHHFHIDKAHNVEICSACGSEDPVCTEGDILIDPDGYVFNVDKGGDYSGEGGMFSPVEAISGVTVTCMVSMPQWGGWVPWPAHMYEDQVNPQVTDDTYDDGITTTGYYAFFTPPGFYYLQVEGIPGYQEWRSPVVQVITEIVHVNVPYTPWPEEDVYTVTITADGPDSATITVPVGSAVEWTSALRDGDTITDLMTWSENPILRPLSGLDPLEDTRGFDAGYLEPGRVYRREFARSGVYAYTDAAGHGGVVVVEAALDEVIIAGPPTTTVGIPATFTATVEPPTATLPITYTWRVSESVSQRVITHTGGLSDTAVFTWTVVGPQVVTVTAVNECGDGVSATHTITVTAEATGWYIYLPLVVRELEGLVLSGAEGLVARGYGQGLHVAQSAPRAPYLPLLSKW